MEIYFDHDEDENLALADEALGELMDKYGVELCANFATEFWFETKETGSVKPELKIV